MKARLACFLLLFLMGCTNFKVVHLDEKTGYFPTASQAVTKKETPVDLDSMKALILVPDEDFVKGQVINIKYFDQVISFKDLQSAIVKAGLQDKVPSVSDAIGLNKAYTAYKPFLWLRYDQRADGRKAFGQFILTDPKTLEDIFIAEKELDYFWAGVNDQTTWYPLFNAFIDYIKANSKTYGK